MRRNFFQAPQYGSRDQGGEEDQADDAQNEVSTGSHVLHLFKNDGREKQHHHKGDAIGDEAFFETDLLFPQDRPGFDVSEPVNGEKSEQAHHNQPEEHPLGNDFPGDGHRKGFGQESLKQERECKLQENTGGDSHKRSDTAQYEYNGQILNRDKAAGCPHRFQDGNGLLLFFQHCRQRTIDADTRQYQGECADKVQEKNEVVEKTLQPGPCRSISVHRFLVAG